MNIKSNFARPISIARHIGRRMFGILKVFLLLSCAIASASAAEAGRVTELMTKALANVPGKEVTMITVDYPPGAADPVHRHYASAFVYVLEGSIVMQTSSRIRENFEVFDFSLDADDLARIAALDRQNSRIGPDPETADF